MSSMQTAPKRFRVERLEERITPGSLCWADNLHVNAMAQWGLLQVSEPQQPTAQIVVQNAAMEVPRLSDAVSVVPAQSERSRFPAWAEGILREIEHELNSKPREAAAPKGITEDITFFSDFLKNSTPAGSSQNIFPVWAQELLADLEVRRDDEVSSPSVVVSDSNESSKLNDKWSANFQTQCEVCQFPAWAEELLSAVDRRISHDSKMAAAGRIDAHHVQQLDEVIGRRLALARMHDTCAC